MLFRRGKSTLTMHSWRNYLRERPHDDRRDRHCNHHGRTCRTTRSADLAYTPPKRVIPGYSKQQSITLTKQQTEIEKRQAAQKQQAALRKRAARRKQAELEKQKTELEKRQAVQKQQAALERYVAQRQQAELDRQRAELERQRVELEKQRAELEVQQAELQKQQTELQKEEATFDLLKPTAATPITCDTARQIILGFGFENGRVPSGLIIATALDFYLDCHRWDRAGPIAPSGTQSVNAADNGDP